MAKAKNNYLSGTSDSYDDETLDWTPLRELVGMELADWFMAMYRVRMEDGTRVHVYKHWQTRRYLHLGEDGRAFAYAGTEKIRSRYRQIKREAAIGEAFTNWDVLGGGPDDLITFEQQLDRAYEFAERGEPHPYSRADADARDAEHRQERAAYQAEEREVREREVREREVREREVREREARERRGREGLSVLDDHFGDDAIDAAA